MLNGCVFDGLVYGSCMLSSGCRSTSSSMLCVDSKAQRHACCKALDNDLALADIGDSKPCVYSKIQRPACCKPLDNDLALADIGELEGPLVSVASEAGIKQVHSPTQVAYCQARAISLPPNSSDAVQVLYLQSWQNSLPTGALKPSTEKWECI